MTMPEHSVQRVIPQVMLETRTEKSSVFAGTGNATHVDATSITEQGDKTKVTARVENINEGFCPICGSQLSPTLANGHQVLACFAHNIVMPVRD